MTALNLRNMDPDTHQYLREQWLRRRVPIPELIRRLVCLWQDAQQLEGFDELLSEYGLEGGEQ